VTVKSCVKPPQPPQPEHAETDPVSDQKEENQNGDLQEEQEDENSIKITGMNRKENCFTLLVCGTDEDETRTDTMMFITFDMEEKQIRILNIPRDTMTNTKRNIKKINSAYAVGGIDQTKKEVGMVTGLPVDRYMVVNFNGFIELVDAVGGVDFDVPIRMKYSDPTQDLYIDVEKGMQSVDGKKAVQIMRFRKNNNGTGYPDGDLGRIKTQQNFIMALASKLLRPSSITKIPAISSAIAKNTKTDLSLGEITWLGISILDVDSSNITTDTLPGYDKMLYEPRLGYVQSFYIPKRKEILQLVNEKFNPYTEDITELDLIDISGYSTYKPE